MMKLQNLRCPQQTSLFFELSLLLFSAFNWQTAWLLFDCLSIICKKKLCQTTFLNESYNEFSSTIGQTCNDQVDICMDALHICAHKYTYWIKYADLQYGNWNECTFNMNLQLVSRTLLNA